MSTVVKFDAVVAEINRRPPMPTVAPSLDVMHAALSRLNLEIDPEKVIIVAGTNGKGTTSAALEALMSAAGLRVGLYTSPHLAEITERIRVQGHDISRDDFVRAFEAVMTRTEGIELSHFELLTCMAAVHFFDFSALDFVILEVGLGGVWDATNAIPHKHCVIARLGIDHVAFLGNTLLSIAENKFGIVGFRNQVVHLPFGDDADGAQVSALARETAARTESLWVEAPVLPWKVERGRAPRYFLECEGRWTETNIPGRRAVENLSLALATFKKLGLELGDLPLILNRVVWRGRMEQVAWPGAACPVYLSGDHNPQGIASLIEILKDFDRRTLHLVVGMARDKDFEQSFDLLFNIPGVQVYLTEMSYRARRISEFDKWADRAVFLEKDPMRCLGNVCQVAGPDDLIVVTGSLYLVGDLLRAL